MLRKLMIDNWTVQDVDQLANEGLSVESSSEIVIADDRATHHFSSLPKGVLQIDSLLNLLTNIVLYDRLIVDEDYMYTWDRSRPIFGALCNTSQIEAVPFATLGDALYRLRRSILDELTITPSLQSTSKQLQAEWKLTGKSSNPYMSALLGGSAGMLARSHLFEVPYFGHACRRSLIRNSDFAGINANSRQRTEFFINSSRTKMCQFQHGSTQGKSATFHLPPIAIEVIEESLTFDDLITTAVQLRTKYKKLRGWLNQYQEALDSDDIKKQFPYEQILTALSKDIEAKFGETELGSTGASISICWLKIPISKDQVNSVLNRIGIRATLSSLVVSKRGARALKQLIKMLDEEYSPLGRSVINGLTSRYAQNNNSFLGNQKSDMSNKI